MADLQCPKCVAPMRSIERNGVTIERCPECGGIFLDRGELERLTQAEATYAAAPRAYRDDDDDDDRYTSSGHRSGHGDGHDSGPTRYDQYGRPVKKKRRGFLGDLLDFGGDD